MLFCLSLWPCVDGAQGPQNMFCLFTMFYAPLLLGLENVSCPHDLLVGPLTGATRVACSPCPHRDHSGSPREFLTFPIGIIRTLYLFHICTRFPSYTFSSFLSTSFSPAPYSCWYRWSHKLRTRWLL